MPRRHNRPEPPAPLESVELVRTLVHHRGPPLARAEHDRWVDRGISEAQDTLAAQEKDRIDGLMRWTHCLVLGCTKPVHLGGDLDYMTPKVFTAEHELPLCAHHLAVAFEQVQRERRHPAMLEANRAHVARMADDHERHTRSVKQAMKVPQIYAVRQNNGLVKVGWTESLGQRLRAYGPSARVLVHFPANRQEETELHRVLRPALAQGREWYHDGHPLLTDFIRDAVERHGKPTVQPQWSSPSGRGLDAQPRRRRRKR